MWREIMNPVEIASALFIIWSLPVDSSYVTASKTRDFPLPGTHSLHSALHHFDVLHADHLTHRVTQREKVVDGEHSREIAFHTLNRDFTLLLRPRRALFHQHFRVHVVENGVARLHPPQFDQFYEGTVHGEKDSIIAAHIDHRTGIVTASIAVDSERYYIEPSHRHFNESHDFHMITYRASDLKYNLTRDPSRHFCGSPEHNFHAAPANISGPNLKSQVFEKEWKKLLSVGEGDRKRLRRAVGGDACPIHLVATHQFSARYAPTNDMNDVVIFLLQIIDMIDRDIFRVTTWGGGLQNLGFLVTEVTVYIDSSDTPTYNRDRDWNSGLLLQEFSHQNWSSVCLAHLFTAVDLTDGRLGVAYIASGDSQSTGGICSEFLNLQGRDTTANVGVSSYVHNQRQLLLAEAQLVTAHELGHNWGSEHDPTDSIGPCNPDSGGKFLMFPSATDATEENNNVFSPCSAEMIGGVLQAKSTCFIDSTDLQCGNFEVEEGEECDAGFLGVVGQDRCCNATCHRKDGAVCSDVNDPCCDNCAIASANTTCRDFSPNNRQCFADILCNGRNETCPAEPNFAAIDTPCGAGGRCVPPGTNCSNGPDDCVHDNNSSSVNTTCYSYCQLRNMEECRCPDEVDCRFCCQATGGECTPLDTLPDDSTCLGGFCERGECIPTSQDLVQRLFSLFTDLDINAFWQLIRENIVGSVLFVTVIIWIPIGTTVHCFDRYRWKRHKELAMMYEEDVLIADMEDEEDLLVFDDIATTDPNLISPVGKMGLMRMGSRTESIHSDFFSADDYYHPHAFSPTTSPVKSPPEGGGGEGGGISSRRLSTIAEAEDSQQLDPEKDNILTYMGTPRQSFDTDSTNPLVGTDV